MPTPPFKYPHTVLNRSNPLTQDLAFWVNMTDGKSHFIHNIAGDGFSQPYGSTPQDVEPRNTGVAGGFEDSEYGTVFRSSPTPSRSVAVLSSSATQLQGDFTILFRGKFDVMSGSVYSYVCYHTNGTTTGWAIYYFDTTLVIASYSVGSGTTYSVFSGGITENTFYTMVITKKAGTVHDVYYNGVKSAMTVGVAWVAPDTFTGTWYIASSPTALRMSSLAEFAIWNHWMDDNAVAQISSGNGLLHLPRGSY